MPQKNTNTFYNYCIKNLIQGEDTLKNASIKIDGSGGRKFKKGLSTYLRKEIGAKKIKKFKFVDSKKDNLIQLADMVAGAIAYSYTSKEKENSHLWIEMLKKIKKVKNIRELEEDVTCTLS